MNTDAIKIQGEILDRGAYHRAVAIARELFNANIWDGQRRITIYNPYIVHNRIFGTAHESISDLKNGVDYRMESDLETAFYTQRRQLTPEPDGDILWA